MYSWTHSFVKHASQIRNSGCKLYFFFKQTKKKKKSGSKSQPCWRCGLRAVHCTKAGFSAVPGAGRLRGESALGARAVIGVRAPAPPVPAAPSSRAARGGDRGLSGGGAAAGGDGGA